MPASLPSGPMATTLVTGATGLLGSHLVRALADRGDELRLLIRQQSDTGRARRHRVRAGDRGHHRPPRRAPRRRRGRSRLPPRRRRARCDDGRRASATFAINVGGTRLIADEALDAGVAALRPHLLGRGDRAGTCRAGAPTRTSRSRSATSESPTSTPSTRPRARSLRVAAHGLDVVIVNPTFVLGPDDPATARRCRSTSCGGSCSGGSRPTSTAASTSSTSATSPPASSSPTRRAGAGERYILGGRNFTMQRLFADLSRISGVPVPPLRLPAELAIGGAQLSERLGLRPRDQRRARRAAHRSGGRTRRRRRSASSASRPGPTRRRSRRRWR